MNKCKICKKEVSAKHVKVCRKCFLAQSKYEVVYCIDCGKKLNKHACYRGDKRCRSCARKEQYRLHPETNPMFGKFGKQHPRFNGGAEVRKRFCVDCETLLNHTACYMNNIRCKSCARKEEYKDPSNHPNWINGLSYEPYTREFNESLKESIRDRDNHTCQNCGKKESEELKELNKKLSIHHIDYNKLNCVDTNLITLCSKCNTFANADRDFWFAFFTELINSLLLV